MSTPETIFHNECFSWKDVTGPTMEELRALADTHNIHSTLVEDCLQPEHLPKLEYSGDTTFIILRVFDKESQKTANNVRAITHKIAIFMGENFLVTIHRVPLPFLQTLKDKWTKPDTKRQKAHTLRLLTEIVEASLETYEPFLLESQEKLTQLEEKVMEGVASTGVFPIAYHMKRRVRLVKHVILQHLQIVERMEADDPVDLPYLQDLKEFGQRQNFLVNEIMESLTSLLNLQLSLESQRMTAASHHVNEVMRVLTMFSAVFLPITFIAGVYGMNFQHMPELADPRAYPAVIILMAVITIGIILWFYYKGWLRRFKPEANAFVLREEDLEKEARASAQRTLS